ncbi:MAG: imidazole glycerol phosphate synthase subunit HisF [Rhodothermales bacterium]|nr:imidazole glycerol phosphate synthase subunit HisF [Rhodothermales bacterium]MBO6781077.1 imidazole glycerol phosphate synthase subunit HisF [Rhodothermales bacterium]
MKRVIARLDIKGPNVVKGIHLEGLRVVGSPATLARRYYEEGADELFYQDVVASLFGRSNLLHIVTATAEAGIFIPITVGGGLRTIADIEAALRAGADKVAINTAAVANPGFISEAARRFGSSTIVVAIEAIKDGDDYFAYTDNGRETTGLEVVSWAREAESRGAGEIVITSVDREGTGQGFDLELTRAIADVVNVPVIAHGGAGTTDHIVRVLRDTAAEGAAVASVLHYAARTHETARDTLDASESGNRAFLHTGVRFKEFGDVHLPDIKRSLTQAGVDTREAFAA